MVFTPRVILRVLIVAVLCVSESRAVVTGSRACSRYMCITGMHDDQAKIDTYTLDPPEGIDIRQEDFGWMGIGFGTQMVGTPMIIVWPNWNGSFTLSQRQATGHTVPQVVQNPPRLATLSVARSYTNSTSTSVTFTLPSSTSGDLNSTDLIWAYSARNPDNSALNASIFQHSGYGVFQLALLTPLVNSSIANNPATGSYPTSISRKHSPTGLPVVQTSITSHHGSQGVSRPKGLIAHVVLGSLATMVFLPLGILIPRYSRGLSHSSWWFHAHGIINGILGGSLIIATYALARTSFHQSDSDSTHCRLGLAMFILVLLQIGFGMAVHPAKKITPASMTTKTGRGPLSFVHMALGLTLVVLGWVQVYTGLIIEWPVWSGTGSASHGWKVGWAIVVALVSFAYLAGLSLLPRQRRMEQRRLEAAVRHDESVNQELSRVESVRQTEQIEEKY